MTKVTGFMNDVNTVLSTSDKNRIKTVIGDSTNNHRTLTVNQLYRYLLRTRKLELAYQLKAVYGRMLTDVQNFRRFTNRSDAVDINELLFVVGQAAYDTQLTRSLAQVISKAY